MTCRTVLPAYVLVTGASRGLGLATALAFAAGGHSVVAQSRDFSGIDEHSRLAFEEAESVLVECNIAESTGIARVIATCIESRETGPISCVVNNSGMLDPLGMLANVDGREVGLAFSLNVLAPLMIVQGLLPSLRQSNGLVVNITSSAADPRFAKAGLGVYGATKSALERLTTSLALEEPDVTFVALRPGALDTDMQVLLRQASQESEVAATSAYFSILFERGLLRSPKAAAISVVKLWEEKTRLKNGQTIEL